MGTDTHKDMGKDMDTDKDTDKDRDMELGNFGRFLYSAVVAVAPHGLPVTHCATSSNSAINL
jgi:hypothetical protein